MANYQLVGREQDSVANAGDNGGAENCELKADPPRLLKNDQKEPEKMVVNHVGVCN